VSFENIGKSFVIAVSGQYGVCHIHASISDLPISKMLHRMASPVAADILDIGVAVQAADQLCPRGKPTKERPYGYWSREIHLVLPLRNPDLWFQRQVVNTLAELLSFLTDDEWSFSFNKRVDGGRPTEQGFQTGVWPSDLGERRAVTLFSGGIDSIFCLQTVLKDNYDDVFPVTITNNGRVANLRDNVLSTLDDSLEKRTNVRPVSTRLRLQHNGISIEDSSRARAAHFILAGVAFAINSSVTVLNLAENGVGAMSLPMTTDHFGSRATKASHPKTLALTEELVSLVCGERFKIRNLGFQLTKGQMIQRLLGDPHGAALLAKSASCDRKIHRSRTEACGVCSSCILRYAGFLSANVPDPMRYATTPSLNRSRANRGALAIEFQASKLRRLLATQSDPRGALLMGYPQLREVVNYLPMDDILASDPWEIVLPVLSHQVKELALMNPLANANMRAA
jgi:7-cyano-7-deazaguanine synthase in queuosine biosynthesis